MASRQVRVACSPLTTVTELVIEALGRSMDSPGSWPQAVRRALEPRDLALLSSVYRPREPFVIPDCLLPTPKRFTSSITDDLERVAAVSPEDFLVELEVEGLRLKPDWFDAAREPRRWIEAYVGAMQRAWTAVAPLWAQATPVFEREVERVAVALVRGAFDQILDGLPNGHVAQDRWFYSDGRPAATLANDLVLIPMVIGPKARLVATVDTPKPGLLGTNGSMITEVAYGLPGARRIVGTSDATASSASLDALLGTPRAEILRQLDRAVPAGVLAQRLQFAPSGVTHHLNALERAGLVRRERVGMQMFVHRSSRGSAILHLYEP
jgi:DNA-binding transcriptional ArsR family regulator